jgi:predicted metalloprotease with PDZ domain
VIVAVLFLGAGLPAWAASPPLTLHVDAREAANRIVHARLVIPAAEGRLTLAYPKWIPGEHGPTGPIANLAGLRFSSGKQALDWERDPQDLYTIHVTVPSGTTQVEAALDYVSVTDRALFSAGSNASARVLVLSWNTVLLYPKGERAEDLPVAATLQLPSGWKFATALGGAAQEADTVRFAAAPLETLVDSPLIAGQHLRRIVLSESPLHEIDVVADSEEALAMPDEQIQAYRNLVKETGVLFGTRPYQSYRWLLTLSNHTGVFGLEHHESSDNRMRERTLLEKDMLPDLAGLLTHEFVHTGNGKHRRPTGLLVSPDFNTPMTNELLWVYEGLTQYLAFILTARSGLWTGEQFQERLASVAAWAEARSGRQWRPLGDTAVAANVLFGASGQWGTWRRGVDFYNEAVLIWLEADAVIRDTTKGARSLDDFCRRFFGGRDGSPAVASYTEADVVRTLSEVAPYDWTGFFAKRIKGVAPQAPLAGIETNGWRLVYDEKPTDLPRRDPEVYLGWLYSLGLAMKNDGTVNDVVMDSPGARAGLTPGMKVVAVDGRKFGKEVADEAVKRATKPDSTIEMIVENADYFKTVRLTYGQGLRYPHLARVEGRVDRLSQVTRPLVQEPKKAKKK